MEAVLSERITTAIQSHPRLENAGAERALVSIIANALPHGSGEATDWDAAVDVAATALSEYRRRIRVEPGKRLAEILPVRKAVPSGDGGGRFYWRVRTADGQVHAAVKHTEKSRGDLAQARRFAADLYAQGLTPDELIPPDTDPQAKDDEWTKNTANYQPPGLNVRQREKKH